VPFKSPFPDVEYPDGSVYDFLFGTLSEQDAAKPAVFDTLTGAGLTYGELKAHIDAFAGGLSARGVRQGDVIALHVPNTAAFVIAFHGILRAGATVTTLNSLYTPTEIARQLVDSKASRYITVSLLLPNAKPAAEQVGITDVIVLDPTEGYDSLVDLVSTGTPAPDVTVTGSDLAVLPYSSGTTGNAKGVMLTHTNLVSNVAQSAPLLAVQDDDVVLAVLPFFHIYGMNALLNLALFKRAKVVTLPRFELADFLKAIQEQKITYLYIAPPMAVALAKHPLVDGFDITTVRVLISGAAPLDEALGKAVEAKLNARMIQGYGMTELSPVSHVTPVDRPDLSIGSIGLALPNTEFRLVDPATGADIEANPDGHSAAGELWIRGPQVMRGYLNNESATAETIDAEGWLHTGDIGELAADGTVFIVDRLKELIKYKGYQVPPAELEALLLTHPAIADSAVVAYPDEESGEIPRAFVVVKDGEKLSAEEVLEFVAARVAPYKKVRLVQFTDAIPKSASGKILRKDLRGLPVA